MVTPRAALVVVGSEVLSAKVRDENGPYVATRLRERGIRLAAIVTIPDELELVAEVVARERERVDWLFTSGGVGPTHDDVTIAAVARALERPIRRLPALEAVLREGHRRWAGVTDVPESVLRMADAPEGARLAGDPAYPVLVAENVVMLPGVPRFFRAQFDAFCESLGAPPFRLASAYLSIREDQFAVLLARIAEQHPDVEIGSYPRFDAAADHAVRVTFESKEPGRVEEVRAAFLARLPPGAVLRLEGP